MTLYRNATRLLGNLESWADEADRLIRDMDLLADRIAARPDGKPAPDDIISRGRISERTLELLKRYSRLAARRRRLVRDPPLTGGGWGEVHRRAKETDQRTTDFFNRLAESDGRLCDLLEIPEEDRWAHRFALLSNPDNEDPPSPPE